VVRCRPFEYLGISNTQTPMPPIARRCPVSVNQALRSILETIGLLEDFLPAVDATDSVSRKKQPNLYCPGVEAWFFGATWVINESSRSEPFRIFQKSKAAVRAAQSKRDEQIRV
jgi:hypothetical protein